METAMKRKKVIRRYKWIEVDKSVTLQEQVLTLKPVSELQFNDYLDEHAEFLEVRSIGFVDRYYNDYGDLLAVQDGIEKFYLKGGVNAI